MEGVGQLLDRVLRHLVEHQDFQGSLSEVPYWLFLGAGNIYLLDLLATLAFAVTGAYAILEYRKNSQEKLDLLGVLFVGGICTAIGGGTTRCVLASKTPFVIVCPEYLICAIIGGLFVVFFPGGVKRWFNVWITLDAIGVGVFAAIGAKTAYSLNFGVHNAVFFATLTAAGGGCIRDIISRRLPGSFSCGFYAMSAFTAGIVYVLCSQLTDLSQLSVMYATSIAGFLVRMGTHLFDIHLPFLDEEGKLRWPERKPLISLRPVHRWMAGFTHVLQNTLRIFL
jgi:uncharacterized membrane protein YeiH